MSVIDRAPGAPEAAPDNERAAGGYDAFISYSHAADDRLAPSLQSGLQSLAKPWYRRRALRIFRDKTSLSASPELWPAIVSALSSSKHFLYLASPDAAASPWVDQEVAWWREHRSPAHCLIALTGGPDIVWQDGDFRTDAPVPPSMRGMFPSEPLWVDLRWAHSEQHVSLRTPRFRDCVADLAAPIHGIAKDEIVGEDARQHRRTLRIAWSAGALLLVLAVAAVIGAIVAVGQRNEARDQTENAQARELAATAVAALPSRLDIAQGLAAEAYARRPTAQTESALLAAVAASPQLARFGHNGSAVTALWPADADGVYVGGADGKVRRWDLRTGRFGRVIVDGRGDPIAVIRTSEGGRLFGAADAKGGTAVQVPATGEGWSFQLGGDVSELALPENGPYAVALVSKGFARELAVLSLTDTPSVVRRVAAELPPEAMRISSDASTVRLIIGTGRTETRSLPDLDLLSTDDTAVVPAGGYGGLFFTADRRWFGFHKGQTTVYDTATRRTKVTFTHVGTKYAPTMAIDPDADRVAVVAAGAISVADPDDAQTGAAAPSHPPLTGVESVPTALEFVGGRRRLVSASGELLASWDLDQTSRLARPLEAELTDTTTAGNLPSIAITPDGRRVVWGNQQQKLGVTDVRTGKLVSLADARTFLDPGLVLEDGGKTVIGGSETSRIDVATGHRTPISMPGESPPRWLAGGRDGTTFAAYDDGSVAAIPRGASAARTLAGPLKTLQGPIADDLAVATKTNDVFVVDGNRLWHVDGATGRRTAWPGSEQRGVVAVATSPDASLVATADGIGSILLWNGTARRVIRRIDTDAAFRVALSPDGRYLVAVAAEGSMRIHSTESGALLGEVDLGARGTYDVSHAGGQTILRFTPDGTLWTITQGGALLRWDLSPDRFLRSVCATVGRALTKDEWAKYTSIAYEPRWTC